MDGFVKVLLYVAIGTAAMLIPMSLVAWRYKIRLRKSIPIAVYAALCGTLSTYLWFFLENRWFGGISFFGAVFLVPLAFLAVPRLFRESYENMMDVFAPGICMMLAIMKVQCLTSGCCQGRELYVGDTILRFPSPLAELANGLLLMIILLAMALRPKGRGMLYPWYMILYGCTRFVLQFFREEWVTRTGILPTYGTLWSVLSVAIGVFWIWKSKKKVQAADPVQTEK